MLFNPIQIADNRMNKFIVNQSENHDELPDQSGNCLTNRTMEIGWRSVNEKTSIYS